MPRLRIRTRDRASAYEITIGSGILNEAGRIARDCLGQRSQRLALVSDKRVYPLYGAQTVQSLGASGFSVRPWLIEGGERHKSLRTAETLLRFFYETGLERGDAVVALGGGVVGDVAGFAAAIYLRGIRTIQLPTTLLAQIDSSVGGKTGVNLPGGKNLVGAFHQPAAVVIDAQTLATLPAREQVAGWCECVKQGTVGGRQLFKQTTDLLQASRSEGLTISARLEKLLASHCAFKAAIVSGDEREDIARHDHRSRRILNFGHTVGHALEAVTSYRRFRHGEAVGWGMLVAAQLSGDLGLLDKRELGLIREAVGLCGPLPSAGDLDKNAIMRVIDRDKKRAAGQVQWVLLAGIGKPQIVAGKDITSAVLRKSMREIFNG